MRIRKMAAGFMMACLLFQMPQMQTFTYAAVESDGGTADIQLQGKVLKNNMSVTVIVYDAKTWDVIPHANVALQSAKNYAEANREGKVTLTGLVEQQTYDIFISYVGYESQTIRYQCVEDNAEIKVYLNWEKKNSGGGPSGGGAGGNGPSSSKGPGIDESEGQPGEIVPGEDGTIVPGDQPADGNQGQPGTGGQTITGGQTGTNGRPGTEDEETEESGEEGQNGQDQNGGGGAIDRNPTLPETGDGIWKQITEDEIGDSIQSGEPFLIETDQEGVLPLKTDAFSEHDRGLLGENELWARHTEDEGWSLIVVNKEPETETLVVRQAKIPHSIMETARAEGAGVQVIFREGEKDGAAATFPPGFFDKEDTKEKDLSVEYDRDNGEMAMAYSLPAEHSEAGKLVVSENAFTFAGDNGFHIKAKIYNPSDEEDLWYEWQFTADDLKQGEAADADLYIHNDSMDTANAENALKSLSTWRRVQLFSINHHGALPAPASLRIKNLAGFPEQRTVSYLTYNTDAGQRETLFDNVGFDDEGFAVIPRMEHCSSYALVGTIWWWWIALSTATIAALLALIYYFVKQKRKRSVIMNEVWEESKDNVVSGGISETGVINGASAANESTVINNTNEGNGISAGNEHSEEGK